jgi:hypothetical protein
VNATARPSSDGVIFTPAPMPKSVSHSPMSSDSITDDVLEAFAHWKSTEHRRMPSHAYMLRQTDINAKMREIVVDWMVSHML